MNYPKAIKPFYMRVNDDGRTVAAMDVLAPGIGEIIGGSQREERLDVLDRNMAERGIDCEHYAWYRDLRRYGTVPHAGFGLGFERTLAYVTGLANVRDAIPFHLRHLVLRVIRTIHQAMTHHRSYQIPLHRRKPVPTAKMDPGLRRESGGVELNQLNGSAR